jgi:hypothetical protein
MSLCFLGRPPPRWDWDTYARVGVRACNKPLENSERTYISTSHKVKIWFTKTTRVYPHPRFSIYARAFYTRAKIERLNGSRAERARQPVCSHASKVRFVSVYTRVPKLQLEHKNASDWQPSTTACDVLINSLSLRLLQADKLVEETK